jgi:soluble lytic murein transglycosylase-like protein
MRTFLSMIFASLSFLLIGLDASADMYQAKTDDGAVLFTNIPASGSKVIVRESGTERKSAVKPSKNKNATGGEFHNIAEEKAKKHNVDPKLVKAVIRAESNWNPRAVSSKGAVGMMQLMPKTASDLGVGNRYNPEENIEGGVKYLRFLLDKFNGNLTLALAAYNAGPAKVEKVGGVPSIPETVDYVKRVMNDYSGGGGWSAGGSGSTKIRMVVLGDGTVLFTNAYNTVRSNLTN